MRWIWVPMYINPFRVVFGVVWTNPDAQTFWFTEQNNTLGIGAGESFYSG